MIMATKSGGGVDNFPENMSTCRDYFSKDASPNPEYFLQRNVDLHNGIEDSRNGRPGRNIEGHMGPEHFSEEKGKCLRHYLENSGFHREKYFKQFMKNAISSLKELHGIFVDQKEFRKYLKTCTDKEVDTFRKELSKTLEEAVKQEEILTKLGLTQYYPEKLTLSIVMQKPINTPSTLGDVPWYFLSRILMLDYRGRDDVLPTNSKTESSGINHVEPFQNDSLEDILSGKNFDSFSLHPVDIMVVIFQCSSNFLRQILCEKLYACKLGIPVVLPKFLNKTVILIWSLRTIAVPDLQPNRENSERPVVTSPIFTVSCMKLGKVQRSKSKLLNEILNGQTHDTFFHKDCKNGNMDRLLSTELIEIEWYLPSSNHAVKELDRTVAFINYRGQEVRTEIREILLQNSNVILIMVDVNEIRRENIVSSLNFLASLRKDLVLLITKNPMTKLDSKCKDDIKACLKEIENPNVTTDSIILDFTQSGPRNVKDLKEQIISRIGKSAMKCQEGFTWENLKRLVEKSLKMSIDENIEECSSSQEKVSKLLTGLENNVTEHTKESILPLQCSPWQEWAKLSKEGHRLKYIKAEDSLEEYVIGIQRKMKEKRRQQIELVRKPHFVFQNFINDLKTLDNESRNYYFRWLKINLDGISRKTIPHLQRQYASKWNEVNQFNKISERLQNDLADLEAKITNASFGLEHFLREIGQVYEAAIDSKDEEVIVDDYIYALPQIAAELLLCGYPLELMDGDASYVPVTWVKAVLNKLGNLIGKEKKIFILSVLGLQSSGKSTLLNTMFGLRFAVAAGRCTRGIYAQLVPFPRENPEIKCDYILIIDSEGLKASELGRAKLENDNEIATFVLGLGDVTLVNVKGENTYELEDVLEIVTHALLKMQLADSSLILRPSCVFIHQNVGMENASQKLKAGQQKFIEKMNRVTIAAGEQEGFLKFTKFNQVIDFDINKDIFYVSDLWVGDPPMAPANPGYSEMIRTIKQKLLTKIMLQKTSFSTTLDLSHKIDKLWKGTLKQNFVFSLKNNETGKDYYSLENKLSEIKFSLTEYSREWLIHAEHNNNTLYGKEMKTLEEKLKQKCDTDFQRKLYEIKQELSKFFERNQDKDILEQWRQNSFWRLQEAYEEILSTTKHRIRYVLSFRNRNQEDSSKSKNR